MYFIPKLKLAEGKAEIVFSGPVSLRVMVLFIVCNCQKSTPLGNGFPFPLLLPFDPCWKHAMPCPASPRLLLQFSVFPCNKNWDGNVLFAKETQDNLLVVCLLLTRPWRCRADKLPALCSMFVNSVQDAQGADRDQSSGTAPSWSRSPRRWVGKVAKLRARSAPCCRGAGRRAAAASIPLRSLGTAFFSLQLRLTSGRSRKL